MKIASLPFTYIRSNRWVVSLLVTFSVVHMLGKHACMRVLLYLICNRMFVRVYTMSWWEEMREHERKRMSTYDDYDDDDPFDHRLFSFFLSLSPQLTVDWKYSAQRARLFNARSICIGVPRLILGAKIIFTHTQPFTCLLPSTHSFCEVWWWWCLCLYALCNRLFQVFSLISKRRYVCFRSYLLLFFTPLWLLVFFCIQGCVFYCVI